MDKETREKHWRSVYPSLRQWQILSKHSTKSEAQARESKVAKDHGCDAGAGGNGPENTIWYVYHFYF